MNQDNSWKPVEPTSVADEAEKVTHSITITEYGYPKDFRKGYVRRATITVADLNQDGFVETTELWKKEITEENLDLILDQYMEEYPNSLVFRTSAVLERCPCGGCKAFLIEWMSGEGVWQWMMEQP